MGVEGGRCWELREGDVGSWLRGGGVEPAQQTLVAGMSLDFMASWGSFYSVTRRGGAVTWGPLAPCLGGLCPTHSG